MDMNITKTRCRPIASHDRDGVTAFLCRIAAYPRSHLRGGEGEVELPLIPAFYFSMTWYSFHSLTRLRRLGLTSWG